MLRPQWVVARPTSWPGKVAHAGTLTFVLLAVLVPSALARLPHAWVSAVGDPLGVRLLMVAVGVWLGAWLRAAVFAAVPGAVWSFGKHVGYWRRGRPARLGVAEIRGLAVEPSPRGEIIVADLHDGSRRELCPLDWPGAPRLFRRLGARVRRGNRGGRDSDAVSQSPDPDPSVAAATDGVDPSPNA